MAAPTAASDQLKPFELGVAATGACVVALPPPSPTGSIADADEAKLRTTTANANVKNHLRILSCLRRMISSFCSGGCLMSKRRQSGVPSSPPAAEVTLGV
jgi:hypothetical protein